MKLSKHSIWDDQENLWKEVLFEPRSDSWAEGNQVTSEGVVFWAGVSSS